MRSSSDGGEGTGLYFLLPSATTDRSVIFTGIITEWILHTTEMFLCAYYTELEHYRLKSLQYYRKII